MWPFIRNLIVVISVTCLIWFFAESESLRSTEVRSVEVSFEPLPGSRLIVDVAQDGAGVRGSTVRADMIIEGPAAALEPVERTLRRKVVISPGMDGVAVDPGRHTVNLAAVLAQHPDLRARGVSFRSVTPELVDINIDSLVTKNVKVEVDVPGGELEGSPEVRPAMAAVTLPASLASRITDQTRVIARIDPTTLTRVTAGRKETIASVRLLASEGLAGLAGVRIEPSAVDVSLTLRSKTVTIKVPSVPVHVRIAPGELNKWEIEIPEQDRFLNDVTVTGPGDVIKLIQDRTIPLVATVPLSFEELERGTAGKEAIFCELPTGLRFDVASRTVRLKIKRRESVPALKP